MTETEQNTAKSIRFQNETNSGLTRSKYQATAKYDRRALKRRLEIEEWMHDQLKQLFGCKEDDEYNVDIDIDVLLQEVDTTSREKILRGLLAEIKDSSEEFITELLQKVQTLESNGRHSITEEISI